VTVYDSFRTCEFCWAPSRRRAGHVLEFRTKNEALFWLARLHSKYPDFIFRIRSLLALHPSIASARLNDHDVLEEAAQLLRFHHLIVISQESRPPVRSAASAPAPSASPLFPLPASRPSTPSAPPRAAETDESVFPFDIDAAAQAATLAAAADGGTPFCLVCLQNRKGP
jgi:hypothetical protein